MAFRPLVLGRFFLFVCVPNGNFKFYKLSFGAQTINPRPKGALLGKLKRTLKNRPNHMKNSKKNEK